MNKKILIAIGIVVAVVVGIAASLPISPVPPQPIQQNEKLGIVVNTPTKEVTIEQLDKAYSDAASTGAGRSNLYLFWNHIEPQQGQYNWKDTDILMSMNKKNNMKVTLFFSLVNGRLIGPYPQWMGTPGFGTGLEQLTVTTLDSILSRYNIIDSVIIGGELDAYFKDSEGSVTLYKKFYDNVYSKLKQKHPDVKFGNAFSLNGIINRDLGQYVTELADSGDFVAFTYLPVDRLNDIAKTPQDARSDLQKMLELVPDKKIAVFEISWSTSDYVNGNEQDQVEFIKVAYDFYRQNESKIEFFTWYRQYDRPEGSCIIDQQFTTSSVSIGGDQFVRERLGSYTCAAGLVKTDDSPKPGLSEITRQIRAS
ncbi:MAG: hypothetical protein QXE84_02380 [Candidatus Nitrosotenuis sp.]